MPAAVPIIAVVAAGAVSAAVGGGIIGALAAAGTAIVVSAIGRSVLPPPKPNLPGRKTSRSRCSASDRVGIGAQSSLLDGGLVTGRVRPFSCCANPAGASP